ncbi:MAG: tetratricopeptide repeat protein, partial [Chloroflexota bacterium]|nr:tetratricopeptide repeat protein [Chloroflexota bacterium]
MASASTSQLSSRRRSRPLLFLVAALIIAAGSFGLNRLGSVGSAPASSSTRLPSAVGSGNSTGSAGLAGIDAPDAPPANATSATQDLDKAIGVWTANLKRDPEDFVSAQNLALVYYTRGRLTGNADDYARAQEAVDQGLKAYPDNPGAKTLRAQLLYTLHDFEGALRAAQAIVDGDAGQLQALATVGDSQLEVGRYDAAAATYGSLQKVQPGAAVTARLARLASLHGRDADAAALAAGAATEARDEGAEGTSLAFYDYLQGYVAFQAGKLDDAGTHYEKALTDWPGSYLALEGLAKVRAAQDRGDEAIKLYERAIAIVPQPEFLAGLGDLYQLAGDIRKAEQQYATVRAIAKLQAVQAQLFNRQLVLFDVNHGQDLPGALALAERELHVRKDIYGWDAYAWALL